MFTELLAINKKPEPFEFYTAPELWTNEHTSKKMLEYHLNESIDAASRNFRFINVSAQWIIQHFNIDSRSRVIDFGCGPGLYTSQFAKTGAEVTGIDFSGRSIEYAKNEAPKNNQCIDYICSNYLTFDSNDKYDVITMIMCDFTALSPSQRKKLLAKFYNILKPNGSILLDVYSLRYFNEIKEFAIYELNQLNRFWSPNDYYCFVNRFKYDPEKLILDKYTIIEALKQRTIYNWYQCFSKESIVSEFAENGLMVTDFFANVAGDSYNDESTEFAVVATKA